MIRDIVTISMILSVLACTSITVLAAVRKLDGRIVGGENITIESVPYQVSLRFYGVHFCGGSILNRFSVLTAAHCLQNMSAHTLSVLYGSTEVYANEEMIAVKEIISNPNYNETYDSSDVSLVILATPIPLSDTARPIQLATESPEPGTKAIVTGWGRLWESGPFSDTLLAVELSITERLVCQRQYPYELITEEMLCAAAAGGKDSCEGDSGGPLVANGVQVGIVSWGYGCARPKLSGVYTNVASVRPWIVANMAKDEVIETGA